MDFIGNPWFWVGVFIVLGKLLECYQWHKDGCPDDGLGDACDGDIM